MSIPDHLSPIHGSAAPKIGRVGNIFSSVDDFVRESTINTLCNSSKKGINDDFDDEYNTNDPAVTDFLAEGKLPSARSNGQDKSISYNTLKPNLNLRINTEDNILSYD